jgi:hypothetical protein
MSASRTLVHFLKWLIVLPPVYLAAGAIAGGLSSPSAPADSGLPGLGYGAFIGLSSSLPVFLGLWLIDSLMAGLLFRKQARERWVRWVFWGFGLAAGLMPVFAFLSDSASLLTMWQNVDLTGLTADQQAEVIALAQSGRTTVLTLTILFFGLALFTSWWNWRAAGAWSRKNSVPD